MVVAAGSADCAHPSNPSTAPGGFATSTPSASTADVTLGTLLFLCHPNRAGDEIEETLVFSILSHADEAEYVSAHHGLRISWGPRPPPRWRVVPFWLARPRLPACVDGVCLSLRRRCPIAGAGRTARLTVCRVPRPSMSHLRDIIGHPLA